MPASKLHLVTGGAGFIAHGLISRLLKRGDSVVGFDNLSRGTRDHIRDFEDHAAFSFEQLDAADAPRLAAAFGQALDRHSKDEVVVWHMAANSDIQAGVRDPKVDLRDTFMTTFATIAAMRDHGLKRIAFASTSAVYGANAAELHEDIGPLFPISNYGAMKLASEAVISAAVEAHLERAWIFRFPNVVGAHATHGVIYDFARKLRSDPSVLEVLGDGNQQKAYLLVDDLVDAMMFIYEHASDALNYYNIGPSDAGVPVRFIAEEMVKVAAPAAVIRYTGGDRGWVGDVPRFSYSTMKLGQLGWSPACGSAEAICNAIPPIWKESE